MSIYIQLLRKKIRHGTEPDNPELVNLWLLMEEEAVRDCHKVRWAMYQRQFDLLLESISDELNSLSWRHWCLDNINRPLINLKRLVSTHKEQQEFRRLCEVLRVTSEYAFPNQA